MFSPDLPLADLVEGSLIRRRNRFVVDVRLSAGESVAAHTNNTGTMRTCSTPGSTVFLSRAANLNRKLPYTLRLVESDGILVGVDTSHPQKLFVRAIERGGLARFAGRRVVAEEVRVAPGSRLDVQLSGPRPTYVELKNVTLQEGGRLYFPDAVTARGARHLLELLRLHEEEGADVYAVFIVQRGDGDVLSPADHIDPHFGDTLRHVAARGVVPVAYRADVQTTGIHLVKEIPVSILPKHAH